MEAEKNSKIETYTRKSHYLHPFSEDSNIATIWPILSDLIFFSDGKLTMSFTTSH